MIKKSLKIARRAALIGTLGLAAIAGTFPFQETNLPHRTVVRNIMSHTGYREYDTDSLLKKPSTYLTQGEYSGFVPKREDNEYAINLEFPRERIDLNNAYLGLEKNTLPVSEYTPIASKDNPNQIFYSIKEFSVNREKLVGKELLGSDANLNRALNLKEDQVMRLTNNNTCLRTSKVDLGNYTLTVGKDKRGIFTEVCDVWDFTPDSGYFRTNNEKGLIAKLGSRVLSKLGKPIAFCDRYYWNDTK